MKKKKLTKDTNAPDVFREAVDGLIVQQAQQFLLRTIRWAQAKDVILFLLLLYGITVPTVALSYYLGFHILISSVAAAILTTPFLAVVFRQQTHKLLQRLSSELYKKSVRPKICLCCLYDLNGSSSDHCPECGEPLAPVSKEQP